MSTATSSATAMDSAQLNQLIAEDFGAHRGHRVTRVTDRELHMTSDPAMFTGRPGGVVSGPEIFTLVDLACFAMLNAILGKSLGAVTSSVDIHFLNAAPLGEIHAQVEVCKLGRRFAVLAVVVTCAAPPNRRRVALATVTYAIPNRAS